MATNVTFLYRTGLVHTNLQAARLAGSWDGAMRPSDAWTTMAMTPVRDDSGCPAFRADVEFPDGAVGSRFEWGVLVDGPAGKDAWGVATECGANLDRRTLAFTLRAGGQLEEYFLTYLRRLGANKLYLPDQPEPDIRFAVWAPNARAVELVFADRAGYIADEPDPGKNGADASSAPGPFVMTKDPAAGIWSIDTRTHPELGRFSSRNHRATYMFKITRDDHSTAYRTDLYSRCQAGRGAFDPDGKPYMGSVDDLDGSKSCSHVVDPEQVMEDFEEPFPQQRWLSAAEFWSTELKLGSKDARALPRRCEDLVIYELHVPGLVTGGPGPGHLREAITLLDHLVQLGVNAVELMPMAQYKGLADWGYGTSHFFAIEYVSGGRDQFKHFVRACHQRGIAVIMDVVYNHYTPNAIRAQWAYDSPDPTRNIYYWYEGSPGDYPEFQRAVSESERNQGGYIDNESTGWAPRYWEEPVRQLFISSAAALLSEFHVDGFRVDQTTSIRTYAKLHANGRPAEQAKIFGAAFLREWTRTLRLLKPDVFLFAEDHDEWRGVVTPADRGGIGFDASWLSRFYHELVGDTGRGNDHTNLLRELGTGDDRELHLEPLVQVLESTSAATIVYHESHDEAGNSHGTSWASARTINVAVNNAPLVGETLRCAEARVRVAATISLLSAGVPMFFMGEEVGCREPYRYEDFMVHREDIVALRGGEGMRLFRYYQDLLGVRARFDALRGGEIQVVYVNNQNRILAFRRWQGTKQCLVVTCFANRPYDRGYELVSDRLPDQDWHEVLNSDAAGYGGADIGHPPTITSRGRRMHAVLPANAALVFEAV